MAEKSCVDRGHQLLEQCGKHALDPKDYPLLKRQATIFWNTDFAQLGIKFLNTIPASMSGKQYPVQCAVTNSNIICCSCSFKSGSEKNKIVCVHFLPVCFQLSILLSEVLAEHF